MGKNGDYGEMYMKDERWSVSKFLFVVKSLSESLYVYGTMGVCAYRFVCAFFIFDIQIYGFCQINVYIL